MPAPFIVLILFACSNFLPLAVGKEILLYGLIYSLSPVVKTTLLCLFIYVWILNQIWSLSGQPFVHLTIFFSFRKRRRFTSSVPVWHTSDHGCHRETSQVVGLAAGSRDTSVVIVVRHVPTHSLPQHWRSPWLNDKFSVNAWFPGSITFECTWNERDWW